MAPTDMPRWTAADPKHIRNLEKARKLMSEGNPCEIVNESCWGYDTMPVSAQTYLSLSNPEGAVNIYDRQGSIPSALGQLTVPTLIVCGTADETMIAAHGSFDAWVDGMEPNENITIAKIDGAPHNFAGYEMALKERIVDFLKGFPPIVITHPSIGCTRVLFEKLPVGQHWSTYTNDWPILKSPVWKTTQ